MSTSAPRVTIVIPTKNAGERFEHTLIAIADQITPDPYDVLVVDSGSTDGTVERCRAHNVRVISIPPKTFGHGRTRNLGISAGVGEYVVLVVQDAIPSNGHWLFSLVEALDADPAVAGAYSRQIPHMGAGFLAQRITRFWHDRQGGRVVQERGNPDAFSRAPMYEKQARCTFNNVSSIIRRSVWNKLPFRDIPFAEDLAWGYDVLTMGFKLVYEPASVVYHSHERLPWYEFRRAYVDAKVVGELFGEPAQPLPWRCAYELRSLWHEIDHDTRQALRCDTLQALLAFDATRTRAWYQRHGGWKTLAAWMAQHSQDALVWDTQLLAAYADHGPNVEPAGYALLFASAWKGPYADHLRRMIRDQMFVQPMGQKIDYIEAQVWEYAQGYVLQAIQSNALTPMLYRQIWRYAYERVVGLRLGAADRGGQANWGRIVQWIHPGAV